MRFLITHFLLAAQPNTGTTDPTVQSGTSICSHGTAFSILAKRSTCRLVGDRTAQARCMDKLQRAGRDFLLNLVAESHQARRGGAHPAGSGG